MSTILRHTMTPTNVITSANTNSQPMTPDLTSSINNSNSNITVNMPSPPLSPYMRSDLELDATPSITNNYKVDDAIPILLFPRATKPLTSDIRYLENCSRSSNDNVVSETLQSGSINDKKDQVIEKDESSPKSVGALDDCLLSPTRNHFPLDYVNEDSVLHVNPYKNLNNPGYKRMQLSFLSQYQFRNISSASNNGSSSYNFSSNYKKSLSSSSNSKTFNDKSATQETSNSDSEYEKPRTRRFVRQNKFDLEIDESDSAISRPLTPVTKRKSSAQPSTPKRQRTSTPVVYNYDYKQIEDFCPPLDSLPPNNKCLKTDWKGQSMDLSNDTLVDELHPAEVVLASVLRLPCAVYLDSKRRIFQEKVRRMRLNLPFRRTDAQKSCKIDVNKASRLFASFEKAGWFNEKHFQKFM